jgi:hypothetical protein
MNCNVHEQVYADTAAYIYGKPEPKPTDKHLWAQLKRLKVSRARLKAICQHDASARGQPSMSHRTRR